MRAGVVAIGGACALVATTFGVRWLIEPPGASTPTDTTVAAPVADDTASPAVARLPAETIPAPVAGPRSVPSGEPTEADVAPFDATSVALDGLDDDEFDAVVARLKEDRDALLALIDQARAETDPERLAVLMLMLGDIDDPAVVALATELIYSGDPASREQGLDLLKRVQPGDPDVLAVVSNLLTNETAGDVLVPALTALARPGGTDGDTRATLIEQVAVLSGHDEAAVRRTSIDILSRWSDDPAHTPVLAAGLDDPDPTVQRAAAFAFVGRPTDDPSVHRALFAVAENENVRRPNRRGALLSLRSMPLDADDVARVERLSRSLDAR